MPFPLTRAFAVLTFLAVLTPLAHAAPIPAYHLAKTYKLAGDGFWDYLTLDSNAHRLYITRDTQVQVLDTRTGALIGQIPGLKEAHGVAINPKIGRGFVTSGGQNRVVAFDLKTLKTTGSTNVGNGPDAIAFEPITGEIFAMNGEGNSVSILDAAGQRVLETVALGGNPESAVADGKGDVFINIEGTSQIAKVDAKTNKLVHVWSLAPGEEPTGLAYDAKTARLFVGCANQKMIVFGAKSGQIEAVLPIGRGVDAAAFDPKSGLAFTSNGRSGTISIAGQNALGKPTLLATLPTHIGARTMALDSQTHALWVVAADYQPKRAGQRWPEMVPGSAVVLKFEPNAAK